MSLHYHPYPGIPTRGIPSPIKGWEYLAVCDKHYAEDASNLIILRPCDCESYELLCEDKEDLRTQDVVAERA